MKSLIKGYGREEKRLGYTVLDNWLIDGGEVISLTSRPRSHVSDSRSHKQ
jgi:hypothetical protein